MYYKTHLEGEIMTNELNKKIEELNILIENGANIPKKFDMPLKVFGGLTLLYLPLVFLNIAFLLAIPLNLLVIALMKNAINCDMEKNKKMIDEKEAEINELLNDSLADTKTLEFDDIDERLEAVGIYEVYGKELTRKYNISLELLLSVLDKFGLNDSQKDMIVGMIKEDIRTNGAFSEEVKEHMLIFKKPEQE